MKNMSCHFVWVILFISPIFGFSQDNNQKNIELVRNFYTEVFLFHKVEEAATKYVLPSYIQHNPNVATGRQPFIDFFVSFFQKNPDAKSEIKRIVSDKNLVVLHVHSKLNSQDRGRAVIDIFRIEDGKIAEHWDVAQPVPEKSANDNGMF